MNLSVHIRISKNSNKHFTILLLAASLLQLGSCSSSAQEINVHDPVIIQQADSFYLFCTGWGITEYVSADMENWEYKGPVLKEAPGWTREHVKDFKGHIWAPDIFHANNKYYLYYSISSFAKNTSCIGVLTNSTLQRSDARYRWKDEGIVIESFPGRDLWNAIDPIIIKDQNGDAWMSFGSFWEGIKLVKLNTDLTQIAEPQEWHTIARRERSFDLPDEDPGNGAIEAPFIYFKEGFYYLFISFDYCCRGLESDYKIMVGRSKDITGPYIDKEGNDLFMGGGSLLIKGDAQWAGVGHNAVFHSNGKDYILFHAYDIKDSGKPKLRIEELSWDENTWPVIKNIN